MSGNEKGLNHARAARRRQHELPILLSALLCSASIAALVLIPQQAQAQSTWRGATSDYNTGTNWNNVVAPIGAGQSAIFGTTGTNAVNVSSAVTPGGWTFSSASQNYVITGSAVNFGTSSGLTDNSSANISIANVLGGSGTVFQAATGTLTLTGANTYTGSTTINSGTLQISGSGTLGAVSGNLLMTGGTLDLGGTTQTLNNGVEFDGGTVRNGTLSSSFGFTSYVPANTTATISAALAGTGGLDIQSISLSSNDGTLILSGNNSYTGGTFVDAGTLSISSDSNLGAAGDSIHIAASGVVASALQVTQSTIINRPFFLAGSATIGVSPNQTATIAGVIADDPGFVASFGTLGTLVKADTGTLILAGTNTYTGGTTISAGTLQVGNGGTTGTLGSGPITDNGTLAFNRSDNVTVSTAISGTGALTQVGSGTLILTGNNAYTGGTTISAGTLQVGNGLTGTLGSGAVTDNGTLAFNFSNNQLVSNVISGSGSLTQMGSRTLFLTGVNSYTGTTTINSGGTLALSGAGSIASSSGVTDNGTFDITAISASSASIAALTGGGTVNLGAKQLVITTGTGSFTGSFNGTGALSVTSGSQTLNGTNTYTGGTTVAGGTLAIGDATHPGASVAGNVTVGSGATVGGHGTVGGALANNGGTVTPGGSIGTLTVGSFSQNSSGTLALELSPAQASELKVTGAASLAGALVLTPDAGTYTAGTVYTLVDAAGGISGTFSSLSLGSYGSAITPQVSYGPCCRCPMTAVSRPR
jgi:autotransporter-associated beta strand protein